MQQTKFRANKGKTQPIGENMEGPDDYDDMVKSERLDLILQFMEEHPLAMPPVVIYRNLRVHRNLRVGRETVKNYLQELEEDGLVMRVDKESMDEGHLEEAGAGGREYYLITEAGREYLREEVAGQ